VRTLESALQAHFRDLVEMMAERRLNLAHTTILRWVRRYEESNWALVQTA
jgi:transposase-like protein